MQSSVRSAFINIFLLFAIPAILLKFTLFDLLTFDLTKGERDALQFSKDNLSHIFALREAVSVLSEAKSAILYSLEPDADVLKKRHIQKYHALKDNKWGEVALSGEKAQIAGKEFRKTIGGMVMTCVDCYQPRHALRVFHGGHVYDYKLCYSCFRLDVEKDGEFFLILGGNMDGATPDILNRILKDAGVPLAYIYTDEYKQWIEERDLQIEREKERWISEAPSSLKPILERNLSDNGDYKEEQLSSFYQALERQYPDSGDMIRELLEWHGSGEHLFLTETYEVTGDNAGFEMPRYQELVPEMLRHFNDEVFLKAVLEEKLNEPQIRGLVRWYLDDSWSDEDQAKSLPRSLKNELIQSSAKFFDGLSYKLQKADELFGHH